MIISQKQLNEFANASRCHICEKLFERTDIIVKDHDHLSGHYRGAAHQKCNMDFKQRLKLCCSDP